MERNNSKFVSSNMGLNVSSFSLGILLLLLSDALWISSSHIIEYLGEKNLLTNQPFFLTYIKGSMFTVYYIIIYIHSFWKIHLQQQAERYEYITADMQSSSNHINKLSNPSYVPLKFSSRSSGTESDDSSAVKIKTSVRFKKLAEVRHMSEEEATDAVMARMSHAATLRMANKNTRFNINKHKLHCLWVSILFSIIWMLSNYMTQLSCSSEKMNMKAVHCASLITLNIISSTLFHTKEADRITFVRLVILMSSVVVLVTVGNWDMWRSGATFDSLKWSCTLAALGGMFNSLYLSLVTIVMNHWSKLHVSLLLGYAGVVISLCSWPLILILDFMKWEQFEMPSLHEWMILLLEGLINTTLSQLLWLCGSLLTSSSLAGVAISLTIPLYSITQGDYSSRQTYLSFILMASFCFLTLVTYIPTAFPFSLGDLCYKLRNIRNSSYTLQSEYDMEQRESLISDTGAELVES